jgi:hypothetical protein
MVINIIVSIIIIIIITVCGKEPLRGFEPARSAAAARAPDRCGDANFANKSPVLRQFALLFASPLFSLSLSLTRNLVCGHLSITTKKDFVLLLSLGVCGRGGGAAEAGGAVVAAMNEDLVQVGFGEGMMSDVEVKNSSSKLQDVEMMKQEMVVSDFMDEQPDLAARRFLAEIESEMERVKEIFVRVENANNESKALHRTDSLKSLWHRMENDIALVSSHQSLAQSTTHPPPPVSLHPSVASLRREGNYGRFLMIDLYEAGIHCYIQRRLETFPSIDGTCLIVTEPRSFWTPTFFLICNCISVCSSCR